MTKKVPEMLSDLARIYEERNAIYGDNFLSVGVVFQGMFPDGITLKSKDDFNRFALFAHIVDKLTRYGKSFMKGGHADSLDDAAVYAMILQYVDAPKEELVKEEIKVGSIVRGGLFSSEIGRVENISSRTNTALVVYKSSDPRVWPIHELMVEKNTHGLDPEFFGLNADTTAPSERRGG